MPTHRQRPYLLCYDIADPKRLQRVHRIAIQHGIQWQYSVYYHYLNRRQAEALMNEIAEVIEADEDDVRLYPISGTPDIRTLGRKPLSEGVYLLGLPLPEERVIK